MTSFRKGARLGCFAAAMASFDASAVYLGADGTGQALVFPYYTVQATSEGGWNTYLSLVNQQQVAKVVRVRVREGRNGREVLGFNLYLGANDAWSGAIVPASAVDSSGGKVITIDTSCTSPSMPPTGMELSASSYTGANDDGLGTGIERTREGYVEVLEMANLAGPLADAITPSGGVPRDCAFVAGPGAWPADWLTPPSGGLSGTLTLIEVGQGMDLGLNAVALAGLTSEPIYRGSSDPYPDYDAPEVLPRSLIVANGVSYLLDWASGVDAVNSVLMADEIINEYILDRGTASQTDWVITLPTRRFFDGAVLEFEGYDVGMTYFNRQQAGATRAGGENYCGFSMDPCGPIPLRAATVAPVSNDWTESGLLGSANRMVRIGEVHDGFPSGWQKMRASPNPAGFSRMESLAGSRAFDHASGAATSGKFVVTGLPAIGFIARTFRNGLLECGSAGHCQGNYGGAFPHRYRRSITPAP